MFDPRKWVEDRAAENSIEDRRNGGRKATWWDKTVGGVVGADVEGAVDADYDYTQNTRALQELKGTGNSRSQLNLGEGNLTPEQVRGAKANYDKAETERMLRDAEGRQTRATAQLQAPGLEEARSTNQRLLQQGNNQMTLATAQMQQNSNPFMAQMADTKDQRAMELQMRREDMDRLDRRDEKNRRRDSIAALTSGLAALGAAFAL
jgi:hypothetical protein